MEDRACLLVLPDGAATQSDAVLEAARSTGLDPGSLRIHLNGRALAAAARGSIEKLSHAAQALTGAGLASVVVTDEEARALPRLELAGGVLSEGDRLSLLVHGRPYGPPSGVPLLFVVGDLGRGDPVSISADLQPAASFRQRLLRASFPVVDVAWTGGRLRVSLPDMTWRGLSGHGLSSAENLARMLGTLGANAAGTVVDLGFAGQDLPVDPNRPPFEPMEGVDRERMELFDRYAAAAALAWEKGIYPVAGPGQVAPVGSIGRALVSACDARTFFSAPARGRSAPTIPWVRGGRASHVRRLLWPWLVAPPALTLWLIFRLHEPGPALLLGGAAFAVCGLASVAVGLQALARREKVRAVPLSKVRSMPMGAVGLVGRVVAIAPFRAPYSRAECVWYRFEIRQNRGDGSAVDMYRTLEKGTSGDVPFLLHDDTGSVLVQPVDAEVDSDPETFLLDQTTIAIEWALAVGVRVFVSGFAQRRSTDSSGAKPAVLPDRDDVFVGSGPDTPLTIAVRSRAEEVHRLSHRFHWPIAVGAAYLMVAVLLWVSVRSVQ